MRLYLLASGLVLSGAFAIAQESTTPVVEVGANYSFVRFNSSQGQREFTQNGGSGYVEYNLNRVVGLVADLGGYNNGSLWSPFQHAARAVCPLRSISFWRHVRLGR